MGGLLLKIVVECWLVLTQMSFFLLFGFLVAGALSVWVSPQWVERRLGGRGWRPVLTASLFGVPLPLCSCGVIPVSASIRRHGASRAATTAFLLSTPQTGVESIAVTYAMLGPVFAVFRPVAALITGLVGGMAVQLFGEKDEANEGDEADATSSPSDGSDDCCEGPRGANRLVRALHYALVTLPRDVGAALIVGVVIAGVLGAVVPENRLEAYFGSGILAILVAMVAGVPLYVCATASVPIAAGFMLAGASPGAALAFLIAGPATNTATLAMVWKVLGRRTAVLYLLTVALSAVGCGLALDALVPAAQAAMPGLGEHGHHAEGIGWFDHLWAVVLLVVLAYSYRFGKTSSSLDNETDKPVEADRVSLSVGGMTCSHCAATVQRTLTECQGVDRAEVDLARAEAVVSGSGLDRQGLVDAVAALGYTAALGVEHE